MKGPETEEGEHSHEVFELTYILNRIFFNHEVGVEVEGLYT